MELLDQRQHVLLQLTSSVRVKTFGQCCYKNVVHIQPFGCWNIHIYLTALANILPGFGNMQFSLLVYRHLKSFFYF